MNAVQFMECYQAALIELTFQCRAVENKEMIPMQLWGDQGVISDRD